MRKVLASAHRHRRLRSATALAALGALVLTSGGVLMTSASADQPTTSGGNNGTIKIDGIEFEAGEAPSPGQQGNEPFVRCSFDVQWWNFTAEDGNRDGDGRLDASVAFSLQEPTAGEGYALAPLGGALELAFTPGQVLNASQRYSPVISGTPQKGPDDKHGYKLKVLVETEAAQGNSIKKHKVFWVSPCQEDQEILVPSQPGTSDPCNPTGVTSNITFVVPGDTAQLDWTLLGNGNVTVAPKPGFKFSGTSQLVTFQLPADSGELCNVPPPPPPLQELTPAVTFTDPTCEDLDGAAWDGTLEAVLDYEASGDVAAGETITIEATIETGLTGEYKFAVGAQTEFTHTFDDITLEDCVAGEETVVPEPKPEKPEPAVEPDSPPTVAGVQVVAPPAAAPTAVAAGLVDGSASPAGQLLGQGLAGIGLAMLVAAGWLGSPRRLRGAHQL